MLLEKHEVDAGARNEVMRTPLHVAALCDSEKTAEMLLGMYHVDANARDKTQRTPLHLAASQNSFKVVKILLARDDVDPNARDECLQTPLHCACGVYQDNAVVAGILLATRVVDPNARDISQQTPLHVATSHSDVEVARVLLEHGAVVNACNKNDNIALQIAKREGGHTSSVVELLESLSLDSDIFS